MDLNLHLHKPFIDNPALDQKECPKKRTPQTSVPVRISLKKFFFIAIFLLQAFSGKIDVSQQYKTFSTIFYIFVSLEYYDLYFVHDDLEYEHDCLLLHVYLKLSTSVKNSTDIGMRKKYHPISTYCYYCFLLLFIWNHYFQYSLKYFSTDMCPCCNSFHAGEHHVNFVP